jgi:hypothetical protein
MTVFISLKNISFESNKKLYRGMLSQIGYGSLQEKSKATKVREPLASKPSKIPISDRGIRCKPEFYPL